MRGSLRCSNLTLQLLDLLLRRFKFVYLPKFLLLCLFELDLELTDALPKFFCEPLCCYTAILLCFYLSLKLFDICVMNLTLEIEVLYSFLSLIFGPVICWSWALLALQRSDLLFEFLRLFLKICCKLHLPQVF